MPSILKISLHNSANGLLKGYALLVKAQQRFFLVARTNDLTIQGREAAVPGLAFNAAGGVTIRELDASRTEATDSPETFLIGLRSGDITDDVLSAYRLENRGVLDNASEVFEQNLDDIFAQELNCDALASGILVKRGYTQNETYSGYSGYHHNRRVHRFNTPLSNDKPYRIGVELEVYARSEDAFNRITRSRTNWFQCETDGSLHDDPEGTDWPIEIKTIPLKPSDATSLEFWREPMARLAQLAKSAGCQTTGLHVHISKEILGANETVREENLNKLTFFYSYFVEEDPVAREKNKIICGRAQGYGGGHSKGNLADFAKSAGVLAQVAEKPAAFKQMTDEIKRATRNTRGDINVGNWGSFGTIEFRKGDGRISKTRMAAICTWWEQMCLYVVNTHPRDYSFDSFFNKVCRDYPAVAYFFQQDEEA